MNERIKKKQASKPKEKGKLGRYHVKAAVWREKEHGSVAFAMRHSDRESDKQAELEEREAMKKGRRKS